MPSFPVANAAGRRKRARADRRFRLGITGVAAIVGMLWVGAAAARARDGVAPTTITLPAPATTGTMSLEQSIHDRRSVRGFSKTPLTVEQASQLLWAGQGVTDPRGLRAAPSAGARYPLDLYLIAGDVTGLAAGVYRYIPSSHALTPVKTGDLRNDLVTSAAPQPWIASAPAAIVVAAEVERTTGKYGDRGERFVYLDAGHAAENILLQSVALRLGATAVGGFNEAALREILGVPQAIRVMELIPLGTPQRDAPDQ